MFLFYEKNKIKIKATYARIRKLGLIHDPGSVTYCNFQKSKN